jgi:hypothetical protein
MHELVDRSDLFPVTTTPFAKHEMDAQTQLLPPGQFVVERLGLQARRRPQLGDSSAKPLTSLLGMLASQFMVIYRANYALNRNLRSHPDTILVLRYQFVERTKKSLQIFIIGDF